MERFLPKIGSVKDWKGELSKQEPLPKVPVNKEKFIDVVLHRHQARKAGLHWDLRLGDPVTQKTWNWAIRKGLPEPGQMREMFPTGYHCMAWHTRIATILGVKTIYEIVENKSMIPVYSWDGKNIVCKPVCGWYKRSGKDGLRVVIQHPYFIDGIITIDTTKGHKFYTPNGERYAGDLKKGDKVYYLDLVKGIVEAEVMETIERPEDQDYYNITVKDTHCYFAENILVGNSYEYLQREKGVLPEGHYGAGSFSTDLRSKGEVIESEPGKIRFVVYNKRSPEEFLIRKYRNQWLIQNVTPTRKLKKWDELIPRERPHYKEKKVDSVDLENPDEIAQAKIDGAHAIMYLEANKVPRVFSYREAKSTETGFIDHSFKIRHTALKKTPEDLHGTLIRGELFAVDKEGKAIPAKDLGGILNANTIKSLQMQKEKGITLKFAPFDVVRYKGKNVEKLPYEKKYELIQDLAKKIPGMVLPPAAETPYEKRRLLTRIQKGEEPLTREGLVLWHKKEPITTKVKFRPEFDVKVENIFPSEHKGWAGGFTYKTDTGRIGYVGSGFTHKQRELLLKHPEKFKGLVAKVEAQEVFPSGVLRAPVFKEWHLDKSPARKLEEVYKLEGRS